jgi:hypothetical protein
MSQDVCFPVIDSQLDLDQAIYDANREAWKPVLQDFADNLKKTTSEGNPQSLSRHEVRGQLLARDRISMLLDPDTSFLELGSFAGFDLEDSSPCASLLAGIGSISGRTCLVIAHIATQSGGAWNELTVIKQNRVTEIANENDLPLVALVQSAGVFLPQQFRVFHKGGQIFRDLAVRTQNEQASCAIVFGSSTAGGAYHPGLSDYTIFVENQAQVFLAGPPLVKMATGEIINPEQLGGARVHGTVTGLADQIAFDEFDAIRKAREWVSTLSARHLRPQRLGLPLPPRYPIEDIFSIVNPDIRKPFDMKEVVLRLVDDSRLAIFKPEYGPNLLTCWAHILGKKAVTVFRKRILLNRLRNAVGYHCQPDAHHQSRRSIQRCTIYSHVQPTKHPDSFPAQRDRFHGRFQGRTRSNHQERSAVCVCSQLLKSASYLGDSGRLIRGWELCHVRQVVSASLSIHMANRAMQCHGRRAAVGRDGASGSQQCEEQRHRPKA